MLVFGFLRVVAKEEGGMGEKNEVRKGNRSTFSVVLSDDDQRVYCVRWSFSTLEIWFLGWKNSKKEKDENWWVVECVQ